MFLITNKCDSLSITGREYFLIMQIVDKMKKLFLFLIFSVMPFVAGAQIKFAYFSYDEALKSMPEYAAVMSKMDGLRQQYDAETKRVEQEFNVKYEAFLEGQKDFAPIILQKRQTELQELMQKNIDFRAKAAELLKQAEEKEMISVRKKITDVLTIISRDRGYAFVINTDNNACPYVDNNMGDDINNLVKGVLNSAN